MTISNALFTTLYWIFLNSVGDLISATSVNNEHTILIVDDEINNLQLLKRTFRGKYKILTAYITYYYKRT